jgi:hypothetical protein
MKHPVRANPPAGRPPAEIDLVAEALLAAWDSCSPIPLSSLPSQCMVSVRRLIRRTRQAHHQEYGRQVYVAEALIGFARAGMAPREVLAAMGAERDHDLSQWDDLARAIEHAAVDAGWIEYGQRPARHRASQLDSLGMAA